jgi:type II secretory pathway component PulF
LAIPASAGRPFDDALGPLATSAASPFDRRRFARVRERYAAGVSLWPALAAGRIVSRRDADLLAAAEIAGNLPWALNLLADRYDERQRRRFAMFLEIVQPTIVFLLGAVVLFICVGIFLPLVQLINDLG